MDLAPDDLRSLMGDFETHLNAKNRSAGTIGVYLRHTRLLVEWLQQKGHSTIVTDISKKLLETYFAEMRDRPSRRSATGEPTPVKPSYIASQYRSLQQVWAWLAREEEIEENPFDGMQAPNAPEPLIPVVSEDDLRKLIKACEGKTFEQRRDMALLRLYIDTGGRAMEICRMREDDIDWGQRVVHVTRKGSRPGALPFAAKTAEAMRRYYRTRARHPMAASTTRFWLGLQGPLTDSGIRQILERRCDDAGIDRINLHRFRHTAAHRWSVAGGNVTDLMVNMGWTSPTMAYRYGRSAAGERAIAAHQRLALGDRL